MVASSCNTKEHKLILLLFMRLNLAFLAVPFVQTHYWVCRLLRGTALRWTTIDVKLCFHFSVVKLSGSKIDFPIWLCDTFFLLLIFDSLRFFSIGISFIPVISSRRVSLTDLIFCPSNKSHCNFIRLDLPIFFFVPVKSTISHSLREKSICLVNLFE